MPTASITLPDGTVISVDGSVSEVERIIKVYAEATTKASGSKSRSTPSHAKPQRSSSNQAESDQSPDIAGIVNKVHDCDETESIEKQILDKRDALNRVLLPLYIVHQYFGDAWGLTSGDVEKITDDLKVKVQIADASRTLSGRAKKYIQADSVRKKGAAVRYKLNRNGIRYIQELLET